MILHLGGNVVVSMKDIIAIMDIKATEQATINKEFLNIVKDEGFINQISNNPPKTCVLADIDKKAHLYLSPISSVTLLKRCRAFTGISMDRKEYKEDTK